eukprot:scaffold149_cov315-Pinguiococcus_pyrenoidosus.AAC.95
MCRCLGAVWQLLGLRGHGHRRGQRGAEHGEAHDAESAAAGRLRPPAESGLRRRQPLAVVLVHP